MHNYTSNERDQEITQKGRIKAYANVIKIAGSAPQHLRWFHIGAASNNGRCRQDRLPVVYVASVVVSVRVLVTVAV